MNSKKTNVICLLGLNTFREATIIAPQNLTAPRGGAPLLTISHGGAAASAGGSLRAAALLHVILGT